MDYQIHVSGFTNQPDDETMDEVIEIINDFLDKYLVGYELNVYRACESVALYK